MRTLALMATLTMVALAFAGCSGDGDGDGDSSSSSSSTSRSTSSSSTSTSRSATSTTSSSSTSTGPSNRAPSGSISVAVNGTSATFALTGSDPDGDTLVWDLTFGDGNSTNGTSLPVNRTHAYTVTGNFTANFTVTDGKAPATYSVPVAITAGGGTTGFAFGGTVSGPCGQCTVVIDELQGSPLPATPIPSASWVSRQQGADARWSAFPAELVGRDFVITTSATDAAGAALTTCEPTALVLALFDDESGPETGTIPAGTGCILIWEFPPIPGAPSGADLVFAVV